MRCAVQRRQYCPVRAVKENVSKSIIRFRQDDTFKFEDDCEFKFKLNSKAVLGGEAPCGTVYVASMT